MNNALAIINKRKDVMLRDVNPLVSNKELWFSCLKEALTANPKILQASEREVISCVNKAMRDGLFLDGKEAMISTFNSKDGVKLSYIPMVSGVIKKMRLEGGVSTLIAKAVYENDDIDIWVDDEGQHIKHRFSLKGGRGKLIGAYAMATVDGEKVIEYLDEEQIDKRRRQSPSVKYAKSEADVKKTVWGQWPDQMYVKSAIHALKKFIPTVQNNSALFQDENIIEETSDQRTQFDKMDEGITEQMVDITPQASTEEEAELAKQTNQFEQFMGGE
ncbi:rect family [Caudoviricetes sp.]|nr:rect family [Caudoviricetes sp.]